MAKTKHIHVIEQTIIRRVQFNPADLAEAAVVQQQLVNTAKPMVGYVSQTTRMTKAPSPAVDPLAVPAVLARK